LAATSLIFCVAMIVGSQLRGTYFKEFDTWSAHVRSSQFAIEISGGTFSFSRTIWYGNSLMPKAGEGLMGGVTNYHFWAHCGLTISRGDLWEASGNPNGLGEKAGSRRIDGHGLDIGINLWWLALASTILPILRIVVYWHESRGGGGRRVSGLCARCGYDLRATPDKCPECGAKPVRMGLSN
jgi:hypothetical protein